MCIRDSDCRGLAAPHAASPREVPRRLILPESTWFHRLEKIGRSGGPSSKFAEGHAIKRPEGVDSAMNRDLRGERGVVKGNDTAAKAGAVFW